MQTTTIVTRRLFVAAVAGLPTAAASAAAEPKAVWVVGFDNSSSAVAKGANPYTAPLDALLKAIGCEEQVYGTLIDGRGLAEGAPPIDFRYRCYDWLRDRSEAYAQAVELKRKHQLEILAGLLKKQPPAPQTDIVGFFHTAAQILNSYPTAPKGIVLFTDMVHEMGSGLNLAKANLATERDLDALVGRERAAGRLPDLKNIRVYCVTGTAMQNGVLSDRLLRIKAFWEKRLKASNADLKLYAPVLVNFGK